jgi:hypothetical protein
MKFKVSLAFLFLLTLSCNDRNDIKLNKIEDCKNPVMRESSNSNHLSKFIEVSNSQDQNDTCICNFTFNYWVNNTSNGLPLFCIKGILFRIGQDLYIRNGEYTYPLFPFSFKINVEFDIQGVISFYNLANKDTSIINRPKNYHLLVEDKHFDKKYQDIIYSIRFKAYSTLYKDLDIVFLVGSRVGVVGCYEGFNTKGKKYLTSFVGDIDTSNFIMSVLK